MFGRTRGPTRIITSINIPTSLRHNASQQEEMAFDFFRLRTSVKLSGILDPVFWGTLVFQASAQEAAILHALTALGAVDLSKAIQRNQTSVDDASCMGRYELLALQQYNKAIGRLSVHFEEKNRYSLQVALISCMIFICIELLRENLTAANTHFQNGLKLLDEIQHPLKPSLGANPLMLRLREGSIEDSLIKVFTRLSIHSQYLAQAYR